MKRLLRVLLVVSVSALMACGGQGPYVPRASSEFSTEHARLFDGRVDFVGDPTVLERVWRDEWDREMQERISASDMVALVRIATLRTATDPEQHVTIHLGASVERKLQGRAPAEVDLAVREGDSGFTGVNGNQRQILEHMFIAFVKWQERPNGEVTARWHLKPATPNVVEQVEFLIDGRTPTRQQR